MRTRVSQLICVGLLCLAMSVSGSLADGVGPSPNYATLDTTQLRGQTYELLPGQQKILAVFTSPNSGLVQLSAEGSRAFDVYFITATTVSSAIGKYQNLVDAVVRHGYSYYVAPSCLQSTTCTRSIQTSAGQDGGPWYLIKAVNPGNETVRLNVTLTWNSERSGEPDSAIIASIIYGLGEIVSQLQSDEYYTIRLFNEHGAQLSSVGTQLHDLHSGIEYLQDVATSQAGTNFRTSMTFYILVGAVVIVGVIAILALTFAVKAYRQLRYANSGIPEQL